MDSSERTRGARATFAFLEGPFLPPGPQQLIHQYGPVQALEQLAAHADADASPQPTMSWHKIHTYADTALARAARSGARILIPEDDHWPPSLIDHPQAASRAQATNPQCLWVRGPGTLPTITEGAVAVVGTRTATSYGRHVATQLGYELATAGRPVAATSGFGVDACALSGALAAGGPAVAVSPTGIDILYPHGNKPLLERVAESGLLVTAWPPGSEPTRHGFAATGRLLARLVSAVVLVEAGRRSAALTVLTHTLELGRPAMVIPGPVTSSMSTGTHDMLRTYPRTRLVRDSADVIAELSHVD